MHFVLSQDESTSALQTVLQNETLVFWGAIALMSVVPVIATYWAATKKHQLEAELKMRMVDAGFSAEEIERVLQSGSGDSA